jgi:hypothetical protein
MVEILQKELGELEPEHLETFREQEWNCYPQTRNATKLGGWPYWIQSADAGERLIAQVVSSYEAGVIFGDMGNLYVSVGVGAGMNVFAQCY